MHPQDEEILRTWFRLDEARRQRLWLARLLHPETLDWKKRGEPPSITWTKLVRIQVLGEMGFGEEHYQKMVKLEAESKADFEELGRDHVLWEHFSRLKGFGPYSCAAFVAASGDIARTPTVTSFWSGMGLGLQKVVDKDGNEKIIVPRRERGVRDKDKKIPCLPHVSLLGQQIRENINRSSGKLRAFYEVKRAEYDAKYPDRPKLFNFKAALRETQKTMYSCLWHEWRLARGLPAPDPYAFAILRHDPSHMIRISDFYDS